MTNTPPNTDPNTFTKHTELWFDLYQLNGDLSSILGKLHDANLDLSSNNYLDVSDVGIHIGHALDHLNKAHRKLHEFVNS